MKHLLMPVLGLMSCLLCACPQQDTDAQQVPAGNDAGTESSQADPGTPETDELTGITALPASPLEQISWDGMKHLYSLADFCQILIDSGAAELLLHADFSEADYSSEMESTASGAEPIGIWVVPESEPTPVGYSAQLVAFGEGRRLIFAFSAAWYEQHMGLEPEELDAQFRALHGQHGGVLKNYAYPEPDYDISFFQFDFGNDDSGSYGSPYMTYKRFTMHGDNPNWNFYCIGVDAGATLATRRDFIAESLAEPLPFIEDVITVQPDSSLDRLLLAMQAGWPALQELTGLQPGNGRRVESFSLMRVLRPTTRLEKFTQADAEGDVLLELVLAERSEPQELSFIEAWLDDAGLDADWFNRRFLELHGEQQGWTADPLEQEGTSVQDMGVIIGAWEIARREFTLQDGSSSRSWTLIRQKNWQAQPD